MGEIKFEDIEKFKVFIKWKKEKPQEYQQFLKDMTNIMIDFMKIAKEIDEKIENE